MRFERITTPDHPMYRTAMELYRQSFPLHEQREADSQARVLGHPDYHFLLAYDGERFVGLLLCWETPAFCYVEHFCILPQLRGRRYGQRVLEALTGRGKPVILEIDPPTDEIAIRRKGFYERCGFTPNPYPHVHPAYHAGNRGHDLVILSFPQEITPAQYAAFSEYLCRTVMDRPY